ncbi:MAG: AsnC family transcriptional regulator [Rhodospirillales bacterium]|nr:AsnC family transcriptional regulator [Rhodospirillales bacterium]
MNGPEIVAGDDIDRRIVNALQGGFPVCGRPFRAAAEKIGLAEDELIARIGTMCADGRLSRFGPLFDAEKLGGAATLAALAVPEDRFEAVAAAVNAHPEIAHNYARDHALNMWFVVSAERPERIDEVVAAIERETGLEVIVLPKEREYFVGLRLEL